MKTIDVAANTASLGDLVEMARQEAGLILTKGGQPVAQVVPVAEKPRNRTAPLHPGAWEVSPDFDDALPEEFWTGQRE